MDVTLTGLIMVSVAEWMKCKILFVMRSQQHQFMQMFMQAYTSDDDDSFADMTMQ